MPSSPRGWVRYAFRVLEAQSSPHSPRLDHVPRSDSRLRDSKETAISVKMMLERSRNGCRGQGPRLLFEFYLGDVPWEMFSSSEQWLMRRVERKFRAQLIEAGFLPDPEHGERGDRGA